MQISFYYPQLELVRAVQHRPAIAQPGCKVGLLWRRPGACINLPPPATRPLPLLSIYLLYSQHLRLATVSLEFIHNFMLIQC